MKKLRKSLFFALVIFLALGITGICSAEYYWTIHKSAEKNMVSIPIGEQVEIAYTVIVGVDEARGECMDCLIPATLGQCVSISEDDGNEIGQVCARRNMLPTAFRYVGTIGPYDECGYYTVKNSVFLEPVLEAEPLQDAESCCDSWTIYVKVACEAPAPERYEGCSHGYWKNHLEAWEETSYEPDDLLGDVFSFPEPISGFRYNPLSRLENDTLQEALAYRGGAGVIGKARIMFRHAVAALLNAAHPNIYYPATPERVILNVNDALESRDTKKMLSLKDKLEKYNNNGCPLTGEVVTPPATCHELKPIDALILEYDASQAGDQGITSVAWYRDKYDPDDPTKNLIGTTGPLADGAVATFDGFTAAHAKNDVDFLITFVDDTTATSRFHRSCSDKEMNDISDCGTLQGDGKKNNSGLNAWILRDLVGNGKVLGCP